MRWSRPYRAAAAGPWHRGSFYSRAVLTSVQVQVALVARHVIQARAESACPALPCFGEIMIKRLNLHLRVSMAGTGEVAESTPFSSADADHQLAPDQIPGLEPRCDVSIGCSPGRVWETGVATLQNSQRNQPDEQP